jgi:hypothetical protein
MFVPFESLSPESRIWVYQSVKKFTDAEKTIIRDFLKLFTDQWAAHGQPLRASFDIRYDHFIVLAADEAYQAPSGCSIDDSVRALKRLEQETGLQLFDRNNIAFNKGDGVEMLPLAGLRRDFEAGKWTVTTPVFNNLVATKHRLDHEWTLPAGETWLKRYIPATKLVG